MSADPRKFNNNSKPKALPVCADGIPDWLRRLDRWVLWKYQLREHEEWSKTPIKASSRVLASTTDTETWCGFDDALVIYNRTRDTHDGIGFVLGEDKPSGLHLAGVDLDDVVSPDGEILPRFVPIVEELGKRGHVEFSPSGTGIKAIVPGTIDATLGNRSPLLDDGASVEVYGVARYFTVTGRVIGEPCTTPVDASELIGRIQREFCGERKERKAQGPLTAGAVGGGSSNLTDDEVLRRMFASKTGAKLRRLFDGDMIDYGDDHSAADQALASSLMWWCQNDAARADRLFRQSGLMRAKWDRPTAGTTYGAMTLERATASNGGYSGGQRTSPAVTGGGPNPAPDPCELRTDAPQDPGPFPERLLQVPGFIGEAARHMLATAKRKQPVLSLAAAVALQATLAGRKVCDRSDTRTNLYVLGLARSGGGKDWPRQICKRILIEAELPELIGPEALASAQGLARSVKDSPSCLALIDEFGQLLSLINSATKSPFLTGIPSLLLKLYTSSADLWHYDSRADRENDIEVDQPCLTIFGTSVAEGVLTALTPDSLNNGLLGRLLVFEGEPGLPPLQRITKQALPRGLVDTAKAWGDFGPGGSLDHEFIGPAVVPATDEAEALLEQFIKRCDEEAVRVGYPLDGLWTRAFEKANKLALIYACSEANRPEAAVISGSAVRWACELVDYLTRRMAFLVGDWLADGQYDRNRLRILRVIRAAGERGLTGREVTRRTQGIDPAERAKILAVLMEAGEIFQRDVKPPTGRPSTVYLTAEWAENASPEEPPQ